MAGTIMQNIERATDKKQGSRRDPTRHIKMRKSGFPVRRSAGVNASHVIINILFNHVFVCAYKLIVEKSVRDHFERLSPNLIQSRASTDEAKSFAVAKKANAALESCTAEAFRLYLDGAPRSEWNKSAARVFSRSFLEYHNVPQEGRRLALLEVEQLALTRIKTIKAEYIMSRRSAQIQSAHSKAARRRERQSNVSVPKTSSHFMISLLTI